MPIFTFTSLSMRFEHSDSLSMTASILPSWPAIRSLENPGTGSNALRGNKGKTRHAVREEKPEAAANAKPLQLTRSRN